MTCWGTHHHRVTKGRSERGGLFFCAESRFCASRCAYVDFALMAERRPKTTRSKACSAPARFSAPPTETSAARSITRSVWSPLLRRAPPRSYSSSRESSSSSRPPRTSRRRRCSPRPAAQLFRAPRLQRVLVVLRGLGPDAQLHHHGCDQRVLRAALPGVFWEPLKRRRGHRLRYRRRCRAGVLNIFGAEESANVNIVLSLVDFATQVLL